MIMGTVIRRPKISLQALIPEEMYDANVTQFTHNTNIQIYIKAVKDDKVKIQQLNSRLHSEMGVDVSASAREQYIKEMQDALKASPASEE